jgi:hypothetical protein
LVKGLNNLNSLTRLNRLAGNGRGGQQDVYRFNELEMLMGSVRRVEGIR